MRKGSTMETTPLQYICTYVYNMQSVSIHFGFSNTTSLNGTLTLRVQIEEHTLKISI